MELQRSRPARHFNAEIFELKDRLVGTRLGFALLNFKHWGSLVTVPVRNPESASLIANAILADKLVTRLCPAGGTFLDIGAHIGSVFSSVHRHDRSIDIIAIEADPAKAAALKRRFPYCRVLDVAVGERDGTADFFVNPKASGYNSLVSGDAAGLQRIAVRIARIDGLLPSEDIDMIKIDVEGAELGALKGAEQLLRRCRPTVMFESTRADRNDLGYSATQLWEWFDALQYRIYTPDRVPHDAAPLCLSAFIDCHQYPFRTQNYFAIPGEKRLAIRDRARDILGIVA